MPKVVIKKDQLPPISADDDGYNLRIRLISQDRNRISFWTPLYTIEAPEVTEISYLTTVQNFTGGKVVKVVWEDPSNKEYDIYVKWYDNAGASDGWEYKGSTFSNSTEILVPTGAHTYQVSVQKVTYPKKYVQRYSLFTSPQDNL